MGYLIVGEYQPAEEEGVPEIIIREYYGQGMIYKNEETYRNHPDQVCYIAELSDTKYTRNDFLKLCDGNEAMAQELFDGCNWQHPEALLEEWIVNGKWGKCDNCGILFDCSRSDSCPNCGKPVFSEKPWHVERWYEEDLAAAMEEAKVPVTRENLNKMKEVCKCIFEDKTIRNEILKDKAKELFEEVWTCR